jgi:hypothetical protein
VRDARGEKVTLTRNVVIVEKFFAEKFHERRCRRQTGSNHANDFLRLLGHRPTDDKELRNALGG